MLQIDQSSIHTGSHIKSPPGGRVREEEQQGSDSQAGVTLCVEAPYVVVAVEVRDVIGEHAAVEVLVVGESGLFGLFSLL